MIETYGDTSFAAVYYGFAADAEDYDRNFFSQYDLSENISNKVEQLSISEIQKFLENGKKNGEFESFQEAYEAICRFCELESSAERDYDLIYFDEDDIPELVSGHNGYYMSLYTYDNGTVYTLMDWWAYGAMGNAGYEYVPRKNSLRNYNSDAGALYTTYMTINEKHSLETVTFIETYIYEDENKNENSDGSENGYYKVSYIDGKEVSKEECESYNVGDYEDIEGKMSLEELKAKLKNQ